MSWKDKIDLVAFDADQTILACHLHNVCMNYISNNRIEIETEYNIEIIEFDNETGRHIGINTSAPELTATVWKGIYERITKLYNVTTAGNKNDWQLLFNNLLDSPYKVAVVSFTSFKHVLELFLQDPVRGPGLTDAQMKKIALITGLPNDQDSKSMHIAHARRLQGLSNPDNMQSTALFDDNKMIVSNHKKLGGVGEYLPFDCNEKNALIILTKLTDECVLSSSNADGAFSDKN